MNQTPEQLRRDQAEHHRVTLGLASSSPRAVAPRNPGYAPSPNRPAKPPIKGHDAILKAMQDNAQIATIVTAEGVEFVGVITGRDKFTITLQTDNPSPTKSGKIKRVFYKSAIEQFWGEEVPRARDTYRDEAGIAELKTISNVRTA